MRCIFCKKDSSASRAVEHILPESLGNEEHTLPRGIVCDPCNNYFASSVEQVVLESGLFRTGRFHMAIESKRGRIPPVTGLLLPGITNERQFRFHQTEVIREKVGGLSLIPETAAIPYIANGTINRMIVPHSGEKPDPGVFSRFLGKIAIEAVAGKLVSNGAHMLDPFVDEPAVDRLRHYVRYGNVGLSWPYSERRIYAADFSFAEGDGTSYEVLHEWDFVGTSTGEMYFVLAIFGVEYAINLHLPNIDAYKDWLALNDGRSPLYP